MSETQKNQSKKRANDHVCPHTMAFMLDNWLRKIMQNPRRIVGEYIHEGDTVADLGCGPGFFSIEMAKIVGPKGKVYAADLQEQMLNHTRKKSLKHRTSDWMVFHRCQKDRVGLPLQNQADFILAFYMIHETPNPKSFLQEVKGFLKKGGKLLVVEPKMHVDEALFQEMVGQGQEVGLSVVNFPRKKGGRSVLFTV